MPYVTIKGHRNSLVVHGVRLLSAPVLVSPGRFLLLFDEYVDKIILIVIFT